MPALLFIRYATAEKVRARVARYVPTVDRVLKVYVVGSSPFDLCKLSVRMMARGLVGYKSRISSKGVIKRLCAKAKKSLIGRVTERLEDKQRLLSGSM